MRTESDTPRPFVWQNGYVSWAVTTFHYAEELGETMCTVAIFPTWREALHYANQNTQE